MKIKSHFLTHFCRNLPSLVQINVLLLMWCVLLPTEGARTHNPQNLNEWSAGRQEHRCIWSCGSLGGVALAVERILSLFIWIHSGSEEWSPHDDSRGKRWSYRSSWSIYKTQSKEGGEPIWSWYVTMCCHLQRLCVLHILYLSHRHKRFPPH